MKYFLDDIQKLTLDNTNFRKVIFTGNNMQLVLMTLQPNEEIGEEVHDNVDQFFRIEEGEGTSVLDGISREFKNEYAFVVTSGTKHNVINTSTDKPLKLYTIYSPANHPDGTIHKTKAEAEEYEKLQHAS